MCVWIERERKRETGYLLNVCKYIKYAKYVKCMQMYKI